MAIAAAVVQPNRIRLPWSLRGKVEVDRLQFVGRNTLGLPYIQGQIRNRSTRVLQLRIVACVLNERREVVFIGSPSILETFPLNALQERAFRISLHDVMLGAAFDRQELWGSRAGLEIQIQS